MVSSPGHECHGFECHFFGGHSYIWHTNLPCPPFWITSMAVEFTMEEEDERQIPFLDVMVKRSERNLSTMVHRKATPTDQIIIRNQYLYMCFKPIYASFCSLMRATLKVRLDSCLSLLLEWTTLNLSLGWGCHHAYLNYEWIHHKQMAIGTHKKSECLNS